MEYVAIALIGIGFIISLVFGIQLLIIAFKESIAWGLGSLIVPFVGLIFVIMHWDKAKGPFLKSLIAIPLMILGGAMLPTPDVTTM